MFDTVEYWLRGPDFTVYTVITLIVQLLGVAAALEAILKTRTAPGAIAWSLSLVMIPALMLPLYWIFGRRKFRGYTKARRLGRFGELRQTADLQEHCPAELSPFQRVLEHIAQMPFTVGNRVDLLVDGDRTMEALFTAIDEARHYILLEYYIVRDDTLGMALHERLLAKARQGVAIYFLYDEIGSFKLGRRYINSLREAGVEIRSFHSTKGRSNRFQINFRNHRKVVVVDGEVGLLGGSNIGDEYVGRDPVLSPWRDTNVLLRGPSVLSLQAAFMEDWYWACEQAPSLNWTSHPDPGGAEAIIVPTGPADPLESCALFFQEMARAARRRLWIVSPYFVPDTAVINALQLAALRDVDVRILLPEKPDRRLVWLSSFAYLDEVQSTGIKVYRYEAGFLHQKVWLLDDDYAVVSTANLDNRSFRLNFEISAVVRGSVFAGKVARMLEEDFSKSRLLSEGELSSRGLPFRLLVRAAYLLAPIQ